MGSEWRREAVSVTAGAETSSTTAVLKRSAARGGARDGDSAGAVV